MPVAGMIVGDDVPEFRRRTTITYNRVGRPPCPYSESAMLHVCRHGIQLGGSA